MVQDAGAVFGRKIATLMGLDEVISDALKRFRKGNARVPRRTDERKW